MTPTPALPMWLEVLKAVAPLIAALLAAGVGAWVAHKFGTIQAGIARQQAETARAAAATAKNKLKLDLFDRRLAIYEASIQTLASTILRDEKAEEADWAFRKKLEVAQWLFDKSVFDFLHKELWTALVRYREAQSEHQGAIDPQTRKDAREAWKAARQALHALEPRLNEVFAPYLRQEG
ncbi:MAG: hypothetical protein LBJ15_18220 [Comamonas sp.]|jgi:hypothetical protein|uniref:hypothetical protein n=1 Tax=Comamonas sp. TaxID=34028 RepID=UPI0028257B85|nr:hypothetical protein [Comamonas sp.]MDR0215913.1 hypothetical protein [Comamonas sp.]